MSLLGHLGASLQSWEPQGEGEGDGDALPPDTSVWS